MRHALAEPDWRAVVSDRALLRLGAVDGPCLTINSLLPDRLYRPSIPGHDRTVALLERTGELPGSLKGRDCPYQDATLERRAARRGVPGRQKMNPFDSLLALYVVAENHVLGLRVKKLAGEVTVNEATGEVTTTFENTPQVPFEEVNLNFFGGPRGSVTTPPLCGNYTTTASFNSWSGTGAVNTPSEPFGITSGSNGGPCSQNPQPFAPTFQAGSTNPQAGAFTPFTLTIHNPDGDQHLHGLTMHLPPGVAAMLSSVTPCNQRLDTNGRAAQTASSAIRRPARDWEKIPSISPARHI